MTVWRFGGQKRPANHTSFGRKLVYEIGLRIAESQRRDLPLARYTPRAGQSVGRLLAAARTAPCDSLTRLTGGGPIIVLAPHPDDETLGCGGLLAACAAAQIPAHIFVLTDGSLSHPNNMVSAQSLSRLRLR